MTQAAGLLVDYNTRVILRVIDKVVCKFSVLVPEDVRKKGQDFMQRTERIAKMMEVLAKHGFTFKGDDGVIYADSETVGAQEIKKILSSNGFRDNEYQIFLEYTRRWGMM